MTRSRFGRARAGNFAEGGPIRGPGGPKGDKIPATLSDGEYVTDAATVGRLGVPFFAGLSDVARRLQNLPSASASSPMTSVPTVPPGMGGPDESALNQQAMLRFADAVSPTGESAFRGGRGDAPAQTVINASFERGLDLAAVQHWVDRRLERFADDFDTMMKLR